ncbi:glycosyltransferase family 2 protein [Halomonas alkalicola]|uniref:Glycosyltransferase family 2 protein n=1 Tax=Halomonas alkalicola TaxID=1930622 RepID=A0ABY9H5I0_9GAMM|nr:glycosyltransferase family 2 protein [Halomonas alkalicola]WLI73741.1 glycosyltransferase family 2 protein [Halomonas alkalicola]
MPLISIVTPSHNSARFVSETIQSVLDQSFVEWEMIIVDDFSTDDSVEMIKAFVERDSRINLIRLTKNSGAALARNAAIEVAKGRYIAFLDSDDLWLPYKLEKQLAFMQANNYPFAYTAYDKIDEEGLVLGRIGAPGKVSYSDLLKTCSIGCLTAMYDADFFGKIYMPVNTKREDFATWLKLLKEVDYAYGLNENLAQYRVYKNQTSANKAKMAKENWRLYRDVERLSFLTATYYFSHYAIRGFLRTKFPVLARRLGMLD